MRAQGLNEAIWAASLSERECLWQVGQCLNFGARLLSLANGGCEDVCALCCAHCGNPHAFSSTSLRKLSNNTINC